jgi:hypothetical protein
VLWKGVIEMERVLVDVEGGNAEVVVVPKGVEVVIRDYDTQDGTCREVVWGAKRGKVVLISERVVEMGCNNCREMEGGWICIDPREVNGRLESPCTADRTCFVDPRVLYHEDCSWRRRRRKSEYFDGKSAEGDGDTDEPV